MVLGFSQKFSQMYREKCEEKGLLNNFINASMPVRKFSLKKGSKNSFNKFFLIVLSTEIIISLVCAYM